LGKGRKAHVGKICKVREDKRCESHWVRDTRHVWVRYARCMRVRDASRIW